MPAKKTQQAKPVKAQQSSGRAEKLDLLSIPVLQQRYRKLLMKGLLSTINIEISNNSVTVIGITPEGKQVEVKDFKQLSAASPEEKFRQRRMDIVRKYEARLDEECPLPIRSAKTEDELDLLILSLPFVKRRVIEMNRKDFRRKYPLGWSLGQPVDETQKCVESLRNESLPSPAKEEVKTREA